MLTGGFSEVAMNLSCSVLCIIAAFVSTSLVVPGSFSMACASGVYTIMAEYN